MKILLVNSVYGIGSTGKIVKKLYEGIISAGNQAVVCYGRGEKNEDPSIIKICTNIEFYLHVLLSRVLGLNGMFSLLATQRLIKEIKRFKPDIVHLHNVHGYYINYYRLVTYLKKTEVPVIWTLHDELMFTGNCAYAFNCEKWKTECNKCMQKREYPKSWIFDFSKYQYILKKTLFQNADNFHFVTPSEWLGKRVSQSILKKRNSSVIRNGIDTTDVFYPITDNEMYHIINPDNKKIVLSVTDDILDERKGIQYTIELAKKCPEYLFIIVGGKIDNCDIGNIVFVEKTKDQNMLAKYYSIADVFLITSLCDNFPTVCIEALSCGTPIVGFDVGGIAETAPLSQIGLFVKDRDIEELRKAVQKFVCADREKNRRVCREYAQNHYDGRLMIDAYLKMYESLVKRI